MEQNLNLKNWTEKKIILCFGDVDHIVASKHRFGKNTNLSYMINSLQEMPFCCGLSSCI